MTTEPKPAGLGKPLMIFLATLIAGQAVLTGLASAFPDISMPSGFGIVLTMIAALSAGQSHAKAAGRLSTRAENRRFASLATLVSVLLAATGIAGLMAWYQVPFNLPMLSLVLSGDETFLADIGGWLWAILGFAVVLTWGVTNFGFTAGSKGVIRKMDKDAARGR